MTSSSSVIKLTRSDRKHLNLLKLHAFTVVWLHVQKSLAAPRIIDSTRKPVPGALTGAGIQASHISQNACPRIRATAVQFTLEPWQGTGPAFQLSGPQRSIHPVTQQSDSNLKPHSQQDLQVLGSAESIAQGLVSLETQHQCLGTHTVTDGSNQAKLGVWAGGRVMHCQHTSLHAASHVWRLTSQGLVVSA